MTEYNFTLASEGWFPNFKVDPPKFTSEIQSSTDIATTLHSVFVRAGDCVVVFTAELPQGELEALEALVQLHDGEPRQQPTDANGNPIVRLLGDSSVGLPSVMVLDIPDIAVVKLKSWQVTVPAQTTLIKDIFIGDDFIGAEGKCFLAGGEYRVRSTNGHGAAAGSALHLAIVDRDNLLGYFGYYGLNRTKIAGLTNITGTIGVGETVTGGTSGSLAEVLSVDNDSCDVTYHDGPFMDGESLTFSGGATATLGDWDEGDVLELVRNVKDEWIEDYDHREYAPGGSREIPAGMYLRIICFNNHATDELRVKVSFTFGAM